MLASGADALAPGTGPVARRALTAVSREWSRNHSTALRAAETSSGLSREQLTDLLDENPAFVPLSVRLLYAAGMNGYEPTLKAMGAVFGHAVADPSRMDECTVILSSLTDLSAAHVAVLRLIAREPPIGDGVSTRFWTAETLIESSTLPKVVVPLCVAALIGRGLAEEHPEVFSSGTCQITTLGRVVLDLLETWA